MTIVRTLSIAAMGALMGFIAPDDVAAVELDVRGGWQVNLDCGAYATATSSLVFDEDLGTGVLSATRGSVCGTIAFPGEPVATIGTCSATPSPFDGDVSGSTIVVPAIGYFGSDEELVDPTYFFGCVIKRIVVTNRYVGSIVDTDGAGTATRVVGTLTNGAVQAYTASGGLCLNISGPVSYCTFEMLRNDVVAGSAVTVRPNARVSLTFDSVTTAGTASVTPLNDPSGEIPPDFRVLGGGAPIFYDVSTTAGVSGTITTCYAYDDADQDGFVDGTHPSVAEGDLRMLHEEGLVFVDRTVGVDPVANRVCAETTSLSQLVPGAQAAPLGGGGSADVPVAGIKLILKRNASGKEKGAFVTRDRNRIIPPAAGSADDPTQVGATFDLVSDAEGHVTFDLPASSWFTTTSGVFKFASSGDVKKAVIKPGKAILVKTNVTGLPLVTPQGAVTVRLTTGGIRHCARFGPTTVVKDEPNRFSAKGAWAAALLDCSDAALGLSSPSGAFVD